MSSHKHLFVCVFLALPLLAMSQVTNTISYNISNGGTDATTDDVPSGTEWGIPSISNSVAQSKVSGWVNFKKPSNSNVNALLDSDGNATPINMSVLTPSTGTVGRNSSLANNPWNGTPMRAYHQAYTAAGKEPHIVLKNMNAANYPNDATVIVYLGGLYSNNESLVTLSPGAATGYNKTYADADSNGHESYLYRTRYNAGTSSHGHYWNGSLDSLRSANLNNKSTHYADYAVFENVVSKASAGLVTFTVDANLNASGISGIQIIPNDAPSAVAPSITIVSAPNSDYATASSTISGTLSDGVGSEIVLWTNLRSGVTGTATVTGSDFTFDMPLLVGINAFSVGVSNVNGAGNDSGSVTMANAPLATGVAFYDDFGGFTYAANGGANATTVQFKNNNIAVGASKYFFQHVKSTPWDYILSSSYLMANHSKAKFWQTDADNFANQAPATSQGGAALKIGFGKPSKAGSGTFVVNTGLRYDPKLTYTVSIAAMVKDKETANITSNAVGSVSLSVGLANLGAKNGQFGAISSVRSDELNSTNWTTVSTTVKGYNLKPKTIFGYKRTTNYVNGVEGRHKVDRVNNSYRPQEILINVNKGDFTTNTFDHITWVDYIKIETNNTLELACDSYGLDIATIKTNDYDGDGISDLRELARGTDPTDSQSNGNDFEWLGFHDRIITNFATNVFAEVITDGIAQNDQGLVAEILNYPVTNFPSVIDAKVGATNVVTANNSYYQAYVTDAGVTNFGAVQRPWTNFVEFVLATNAPANAIKWKVASTNTHDLSVAPYVQTMKTHWDGARMQNPNGQNVFFETEITASYDDIGDGVTNQSTTIDIETFTTYTGLLEVVSIETQKVFSTKRSKAVDNLGVDYKVLVSSDLVYGEGGNIWSNASHWTRGVGTTNNGVLSADLSVDAYDDAYEQRFLKQAITSPQVDESEHFFGVFDEVTY